MKVLLTTLNAKYIHSSLALRYLKEYCQETEGVSKYELVVKEFTINDYLDHITGNIYRTGADVTAFSCYIWNITEILQIAERLKKVKPELIIVFGGPEVSYSSVELMKEHEFIDYIVRGEGEESFQKLLRILSNGRVNSNDLKFEENNLDQKNNKSRIQMAVTGENISGLVYRNGKEVINKGDPQLISDLGSIPSPYHKEDLKDLSNKLIYYETARGCPFQCSYCLSSATTGVRYFPEDRVKRDLKMFIDNNVDQVKFVDRTFNLNREWTRELFEFLVENQGNTSFHFEIAADLFDREMIDYLTEVPEGLFQFEIGVQSTNKDTISAIDRKTNFNKIAVNVEKLREAGNIKLHLDLIAGLPEEDYRSFQKSFDDVYSLNPHILQLGFLKLLKGTKIRREASDYNYQCTSLPSYEVLANNKLSYDQLLKLKDVEYILKKYYNSGAFSKSLFYILTNYYNSSFQFFTDLAEYFNTKKLDRVSHSRRALYDIFYQFYQQEIGKEIDVFIQYLKFDLLLNNQRAPIPEWADSSQHDSTFKDKRYQFLQEEDNITEYLPHFKGRAVRKILRQVTFDKFSIDVLSDNFIFNERKEIIVLFDYCSEKAYDVTKSFGV